MAAITFEDLVKQKRPVCVVGLGYVGLPLAVALSKKFPVVGFDVNQRRIDELKQGKDITGEVAAAALAESGIEFTADAGAIARCPFVIVAVPTPVDGFKIPDLTAIRSATESVARNLLRGSVVVYESTV